MGGRGRLNMLCLLKGHKMRKSLQEGGMHLRGVGGEKYDQIYCIKN